MNYLLYTTIVIAIFALFYFLVIRPLQKKFGYGTYSDKKQSIGATNENGLNWLTDPSDPRSEFNTKYKDWSKKENDSRLGM